MRLYATVDNEVELDDLRVEIGGSEPFIVGGHCQAGYWIDTDRRTTLPGLYVAGDVAGGAPKKYVTGACVEGELAALNAVEDCQTGNFSPLDLQERSDIKLNSLVSPLQTVNGSSHREMEDRLQEIMEEYAGGKSNYYELKEGKLLRARELLADFGDDLGKMKVKGLHELLKAREVIDRYDVARVLVEHLLYRRETRWPL
ncbi:MAG: hypothetical protein ACOC5A_03415 [Halanaerobiales bacterium]